MSRLFELSMLSSKAYVSSKGAELLQWTPKGKKLLRSGPPIWWSSVAPFLFPIVGRVTDGVIRINGISYPMPLHGFLQNMEFDTVTHTANSITLEARDTIETKRHFPFPFSIRISYQLTETRVLTEVEIMNPGSESFPFAFGTHPGFSWPFGGGNRGKYYIEFEQEEDPFIPVISHDGFFTKEKRKSPLLGKRIYLNSSVFEAEALCFLGTKSQKVNFGCVGRGTISIEAQNFAHWALWSKPNANFICIESWTGFGDLVGFRGEFSEKISQRILMPGSKERFRVSYSYCAD